MIFNPYYAKSKVYKGQLHCHLIKSDGDSSSDIVFNYYKKAGYDFICLTDHDVYAGQNAIPNPGSSTLFYTLSLDQKVMSGSALKTQHWAIIPTNSLSECGRLIVGSLSVDEIGGGRYGCNYRKWPKDHEQISDIYSM